ncbi:MAG: type II toxin-antitoxin system RelE/ParE family toxin [archaeon]
MYQIVFTGPVKSEFSKLDNELKRRILGVLERAKVRPEDFAKRLAGLPFWRLRAGNWRIIVEIDSRMKMIIVHKIGNRENIYD